MTFRSRATFGCFLALTLGGCTVIGAGHNTIILASVPEKAPPYPGSEFTGLLHGGQGVALLPGHGTVASERERWADYQARHPRTGMQLDLTVRDLNVTPALDQLNIESTNASDIAKIMSDTTMTLDQKGALIERFRNNYRRMPENYLPMVPRQEFIDFLDGDGEQQVTTYHWFPKVALDLVGTLESVASRDRFDFIAVAVTLVNADPHVTFANFTPKAADLFDFSLGSLKQTASATGTASVGGSAGTKATTSSMPATGSTAGSEINAGATNGASASLTISDELTRDLKSSLDARAAGIINDGRTFVIQLRSNGQHRVSGTYSYSVMLDMAPIVHKFPLPGKTLISSDPPTRTVYADVRLIGVVRHVGKVGKTGTFKRVPDETNDDTFDEVVLKQKRVMLWQLHQDALTDALPQPTNLIVYTNQDAATFSVYADDGTRRLLLRGKGRESALVVDPKVARVSIEYDPIILTGTSPTVLLAPSADHVHLGGSGPVSVVGNYLPKPKPEEVHGK